MSIRVLACVVALLTQQALAADVYPTRPIRFINPTAPGGTAEPIARVIAQKMSESLHIAPVSLITFAEVVELAGAKID